MPELMTERLRLRPITKEDDQAIFAYSADPEVGPSAGWAPHTDISMTRRDMDLMFLGNPGIWGIESRKTGILMGTVGIVTDPKRDNVNARMLGYALGIKYWGCGYMTEACRRVLKYGFEELMLKIVSAYCYPGNERSHRVLKKLGFSYEGLLRRAEILYDYRAHDNECYSLLCEEYFQKGETVDQDTDNGIQL